MSQVIIHTNSNGGVSVCVPTGELPINEVLTKDCPDHAIIIDDSELPQGENEFFNAWELVDGKIIVNQAKKQAIIDAQQAEVAKKQLAESKLAQLGLTPEDLKNLFSILMIFILFGKIRVFVLVYYIISNLLFILYKVLLRNKVWISIFLVHLKIKFRL